MRFISLAEAWSSVEERSCPHGKEETRVGLSVIVIAPSECAFRMFEPRLIGDVIDNTTMSEMTSHAFSTLLAKVLSFVRTCSLCRAVLRLISSLSLAAFCFCRSVPFIQGGFGPYSQCMRKVSQSPHFGCISSHFLRRNLHVQQPLTFPDV